LRQDAETMNARTRARLQVLAALLSAWVALLSALAMRDRVRLVDILGLFGGGMGAGVSLVLGVQTIRQQGSRPRIED
jgi:hypothetical protein